MVNSEENVKKQKRKELFIFNAILMLKNSLKIQRINRKCPKLKFRQKAPKIAATKSLIYNLHINM